MEAIFAFFAIPLVFYALVVLFILGIALNIDDDKASGWGWTTIFSAFLVWLVGNHFSIDFGAIISNPTSLAIGIASYFVIGVLWSFAKWYFKLANVRDLYVELKDKYRKNNKLGELFLRTAKSKDQVENKEEAQEREEIMERNLDFFRFVNSSRMRLYESIDKTDLAENPSNIPQSFKPLAMQHKSSITQWIMFWPISFTWTIINDPVRKIANYIFSRIKGTFQKMSDSMFAGV